MSKNTLIITFNYSDYEIYLLFFILFLIIKIKVYNYKILTGKNRFKIKIKY